MGQNRMLGCGGREVLGTGQKNERERGKGTGCPDSGNLLEVRPKVTVFIGARGTELGPFESI